MVTDFFSGYGEILESQVIRDSKGQSKGCAFVKFASMTKAEEAKKNIETRSISLPGVRFDGDDEILNPFSRSIIPFKSDGPMVKIKD